MDDRRPSIKIVSIGEAGADALDCAIGMGVAGASTVALDSSGSRLDASCAQTKILLPKEGEAERTDAIEHGELLGAIDGADIVFIIVGDHGRGGLADVPAACRAAKERGAAVAVFLMQYQPQFDEHDPGDEYRGLVIESLQTTDAIFYLPFRETEAVQGALHAGLETLCGVLTSPGLEDVSIEQFERCISGAGGAVMGIGEASGRNAVIEAAREALKSSTLDRNIEGSSRISFFITTGPEMSRGDIEEAGVIILKAADDDVPGFLWGHTVDPRMSGRARVVILASNFDDMKDRREEMRRQVAGFLDRIEYRYSDVVPDEINFGLNLESKVSTVKIDMMFANDGYTTIAHLPIKAIADYRDEVMRFITIVNANLRIGNFDLDLDDGEITFRTYTCYDGMVVLSDAVISRSFEIPARVVDDYGNALIDVMMGYADAQTAIDRAIGGDGAEEEVE